MLQILHSLAEINFLQRSGLGNIPGFREKMRRKLFLIHAGEQQIKIPQDFQQVLAIFVKTVLKHNCLCKQPLCTFFIRCPVDNLGIRKTTVMQQRPCIRTIKGNPGVFPRLFFVRHIFCRFTGKDQERIPFFQSILGIAAHIPALPAPDKMDQIMSPYGRAEKMSRGTGLASGIIKTQRNVRL